MKASSSPKRGDRAAASRGTSVTALVSCIGLGIAIGATGYALLVSSRVEQASPTNGQAPMECEPRDAPQASATPSLRAVAATARPPRTAAVVDDDATSDDAQNEVEARDARAVMRSLESQIRSGIGRYGEGQTPEDATNGITDYLVGVAETLIHARPELVSELAGGISDKLCSSSTGDTEAMAWLRFSMFMPGSLESKAVDCVAARHQTEDVLLFELIDSWRVAHLPMTETLTQLRAKVRDKRSIMRFDPAQTVTPELAALMRAQEEVED